jgi:Zn-dependent protease
MLLLVGFGWASTPVSPSRMRGNPRTSHAIVAVAGPVANLIMAIIYAIPILIGLVDFAPPGRILPSPYAFLLIGIQINILLMVFNLMPIPPLDGFTILLGLLPAELAYQLEPLRRYGFIILLVVLFLLPTIGIDVFGAVLNPIMNVLIPILVGA